MNKLVLLLLSISLFCIANNISALGMRDNARSPKIEVSGIIRMVGNSPMNSLVLSGNDREWYIDQKEEKKLIDLQHQTVTVRGREYYADLIFADGNPAGRRYYLRDITIVKPR
jgi:hypothetical protein